MISPREEKGDQKDTGNGGRGSHVAQGAETRRGGGEVVGLVDVQVDCILCQESRGEGRCNRER